MKSEIYFVHPTPYLHFCFSERPEAEESSLDAGLSVG
jgi:hypothetical protein